jgi:secretion/DNA translocation related CpaE-like protein
MGETERADGRSETERRRPLLVTGDPALLDEMLRLCAAAGVEPDVAADPGSARGSWRRAQPVLVGGDVTSACVAAALPRRDGVLVVAQTDEDQGLWQSAVALGAEQVLFLPEADGQLLERLAAGDRPEPTLAPVIAVVGGRGGAGATTVSAAMAVAAARAGEQVMLLDLDPFGGGIDVALGAEDVPGLRWPDLIGERAALPGGTVVDALPRLGSISVLSWDRGDPCGSGHPVPASDEFLRALLAAAARGRDLVIADLPRTPGPLADCVLATTACALLVVPAEVRACAAAGRTVAWLRHRVDDVRLLVRGPAPGGLSPDAISDALGLPLAGWIRAEPGLAAAYECGDAPGSAVRSPLARFCRDFVDDVLRPVARRAS